MLSQARLGGASARGPHTIGFVVMTAPDARGTTRRKSLGAAGGPFGYAGIVAVCPSSYKAQEQVSATVVLEKEAGPHILVPCTAEPGCEATFALELRSNFAFSVTALPHRGSLLPDEPNDGVFELEVQAGPRKGLGGEGYGFPRGGEGGEDEAAALAAKLKGDVRGRRLPRRDGRLR